jgi:hypothetical protein
MAVRPKLDRTMVLTNWDYRRSRLSQARKTSANAHARSNEIKGLARALRTIAWKGARNGSPTGGGPRKAKTARVVDFPLLARRRRPKTAGAWCNPAGIGMPARRRSGAVRRPSAWGVGCWAPNLDGVLQFLDSKEIRSALFPIDNRVRELRTSHRACAARPHLGPTPEARELAEQANRGRFIGQYRCRPKCVTGIEKLGRRSSGLQSW